MQGSTCFTRLGIVGAMYLVSASLASGQATTTVASDPLEGLRVQMDQLRVTLKEMNDQLADARRESRELRREVQSVREQLDVVRSQSTAPRSGDRLPEQSSNPDNQVAALAEDQQLLKAKVEDQYQTKVESGSRYRVRLSGLVLVNVVGNRGMVDNVDLPGTAVPKAAGESMGSFAATARQSQINVAVSGPQWKGARTSGEVAFDFFGGFPSNPEGVSTGLVRLRTARMSLDWAHTSIVAAQETPFISPLSPTSLASTAYPAFASAGNLWTWTPQLRVEHRFALSNAGSATVQWGILDPLTGELPAEYNRSATAGERSSLPAAAMRVGFQRMSHERLAGVGAGAWYSRQNWGFGRNVDAWAATVDWDLPLGRWFSLSGEAYRGRAMGGLGGGFGGSVLFSGPPSLQTTAVLPLDRVGGWAQWKFKPLERLEFNAAFGEDDAFRSGLSRLLAEGSIQGPPAGRNASGFFNVIYQPRSNLLFSVEYRRLWTSSIYEPKQVADHVSLSSGIVF